MSEHYEWRVGDVFTNGTSRWRVEAVEGPKAVLRSCGSAWATTNPLTFAEWNDDGRWRLEASIVERQQPAVAKERSEHAS